MGLSPVSTETDVTVERTPDGNRLVVSRFVEAPAEAVWDLLVDTHRWPEWGPSITAVDCPDRRIQAGSRGRIRTVGGLWLRFEITACEKYRWTWRVVGIPATGHAVDPIGSGCRVAFELPLFAAPYTIVCDRALKRIERIASR